MKPLPLVVVWVSGSTVVSISGLSLEGANHQGETTMSDKRFKLLSHSLWECQDHLVFCPKYRSRVLGGEVGSYVDRHIYRLLAQKAGVSVLECNVQPDHVHLVAEIPPKYSVSDILGAPSREAGTAHLQAVSPVWPPVLGAALLGTGLLREYRRS
jgi:REP element-mobilizing transposase RayT